MYEEEEFVVLVIKVDLELYTLPMLLPHVPRLETKEVKVEALRHLLLPVLTLGAGHVEPRVPLVFFDELQVEDLLISHLDEAEQERGDSF